MLALPLIALLALAGGDPGFDAIVSRVGDQGHDSSCAQMQSWVDAHPADPNAGRGLVWMAELRLADRRADLARPLLERAVRDYPNTEWGWHAQKSLADLDTASHQYARAIASYEELSRLPSPYWQYVGRMAVQSAQGERLRFWIYVALALLLAGGVAARVARVRRAIWPPPEELLYALPIAAVMLAAAIAQPPEEARAVTTVALGGLALLWSHGALLRARPPGRAGRVVLSLTGICEAAALLYCAVIAHDLWPKFVETINGGAER